MEAFTTFEAIGIPIDIVNCDTDQIIPARFLRYLPSDGGYARYLFHDLRFDDDGSEKPDFIYNRPPFRDGKIIVADVNWGCGSSREQAVYGLNANGIRCVIAPSFGDIHYGNCLKYGVLPVQLAREVCERFRQQLHEQPGGRIAVDLPAQTVRGPDGTSHRFEIAGFDKHRMLHGLDDIAITLEYETQIDAYEAQHFQEYHWLER